MMKLCPFYLAYLYSPSQVLDSCSLSVRRTVHGSPPTLERFENFEILANDLGKKLGA